MERVREDQTLTAIARRAMRMITTRNANARIASRHATQKQESEKTHILPAFLQIPTNEILVARAHLNFSHPQRA